MQDVLFQTDKPTAAPGRAEFYDLSMIHIEIAGRRVSFVTEVHGWWDNHTARAVFDEDTTMQTRAFATPGEAFERYCRQRLARIKGGFKHAFMWHPISGAPAENRRFGAAEEPAC
jgi:hypothetical protein